MIGGESWRGRVPTATAARFNTATDGTMRVPGEQVQIVVTKK